MNNDKPVIISGSTNKKVAQEIAKILDCNLITLDIEKFANGEIGVNIRETVRGFRAFLIQTSVTGEVNDNIIETGLIADALRRAGCKSVYLVQLLYPYERQDRRENDKEKNRPKRRPISARLVANFYEDLCGFSGIVTIHLHSEQIEGFFSKAYIENINVITLFTEHLQKIGILNNGKNITLAGPDIGAVKMVADMAETLNYDYVIIDKRRTGPGKSHIMKIIGDVEGRTVVICDDQIDGGGTVINAAEKLLEMGAVSVYVIATHFIGSGDAVERLLNSKITKIIVTDTVSNSLILQHPEKFTVLPVAPLMTDVITRIFNNISLQEAVAHKINL
jgi:ribose-phosphate pyrophosphokinase